MIDCLTSVAPEDAPFILPSRYPTAMVADDWININTYILQVKGCFIVMDNRRVDWFARVSDWRRYQSLVSTMK